MNQQRLGTVLILTIAVFGVLILRGLYLNALSPKTTALRSIARSQYSKTIRLAPYRGNIYDRRGEPLALTVKRTSLYVNPKKMEHKRFPYKKVAKILNLTVHSLKKKTRKNSYFSWIKRKISIDELKKINALSSPDLLKVLEHARYYPHNEIAAPLIGFVGIDNQGLSGLEKGLDNQLSGEKTTSRYTRDAKGNLIVLNAHQALRKKVGLNATLTIDRAIQEIADEALNKGIEKAQAKSGFAIVMDPFNGELLAVANYPSFDFNRTRRLRSVNAKNKAFADVYEPGSVIKPIVLAKALETLSIAVTDKIDCENGLYREDEWKIRDSHPNKQLSLAEIIIESSNIGIFKIADMLGPKKLYDTLRNNGVGGTSVELPWLPKR